MRIHLFIAAATASFAITLPERLSAQAGTFVRSGSGCPNTAIDTFAQDESLLGPFALGFTFPFVGAAGAPAATSSIEVSSNGYIYLQPGTIPTTRCCQANLMDFAADTAQIAVFGEDLDPATGGRVVFETDGAVATVTWIDVPEFGATLGNCLQVQIASDGRFTIAHDRGRATGSDLLVGYSPGSNATDPGARDLSGGVSSTQPTDMVYEVFTGRGITAGGGTPNAYDLDGAALTFTPNGAGSYDVTVGGTSRPVGVPVALSADNNPTIGRTTTITVHDLPASTSAASLLIGAASSDIPLDVLGASGCRLFVQGIFASQSLTLSSIGSGGGCNRLTGTSRIAIANDPAAVGLTVETQAIAIAMGANPANIVLSDRGTLTVGTLPLFTVRASGTNSFNSATANGFFTVHNAAHSTLDIATVTFDWSTSSHPTQAATMIFDTDQTGMADRPDGGNSTTPGCRGTYRNTDVITGLDYASSPPSPCDPTARSGFLGSNAVATGSYRTVTMEFDDFGAGETFAWDCDTDGGIGFGGDAMVGMVVTLTLSDGSTRSGELVVVDGSSSEVRF